ncbi:MAG: bifunctional glutamate N-acetyltransferase/amino-acid acetyltransferase ArgJ [Thermoguttaceae bacterium]
MELDVPRGFRLTGLHCGIKKDPARFDLTLIVTDRPATAAGVYTQNRVFAAPVALDRQRTPSDSIRAIVCNSGNANACTGERGLEDAREMARLAAAACQAGPEQALVLSTGIIGEFMPLETVAGGIAAAGQKLGNDRASLVAAARGMMTTDTVEKLAGRKLKLACGEVTLVGMAKGAAMIGPNMATMLAVVLTDAAVTPEDAQAGLGEAVRDSFNCISVEGHMSTNDTVLLLANGASGGGPLRGKDLATFQEALGQVCMDLAKAIPADGEGAEHLITIDVEGCADRHAAHRIAKTVAESSLVKTAVAGADPNWGRIVSAAGYAGVAFDPAGVDLIVNGALLYEHGAPVAFDKGSVSESIRKNRDTSILLRFREGEGRVRFWTTDLTAEYVRLNADYHT